MADACRFRAHRLNKALELHDTVLEIGLTPNRADCLSLIGIAREIAGFHGTRIKRRPCINLPERHRRSQRTDLGDGRGTGPLPALCGPPARSDHGGPSPFWLRTA
jgi:phenylalanyl-tRNA synthetase beta chain